MSKILIKRICFVLVALILVVINQCTPQIKMTFKGWP